MTKVIIYKQDNGIVSVVVPTQEAIDEIGIDAIALKDVPTGKPFKIVEVSDLPVDYPQEVWEVEDTFLSDGVGADYGIGSLNSVIGWNDDGTPKLLEYT